MSETCAFLGLGPDAGGNMSIIARSRPSGVDALPQDRSWERSFWLARQMLGGPTALDAAIAIALALIGLLGVLAHVEVEIPEGSVDAPARHLPPGAILLILGQTIPLVWRRIAPVAVLVIVAISLTGTFAYNYFPSFAAIGVLIALYTVAAFRPRRISISAAIACGVLLMAMSFSAREPLEIDALLAEILFVAGAWFLGEGVRTRRIALARSEGRAATLELDQEQRAREAVAQERRIIARELHDVVAHNVSVMVVQAAAARRASVAQSEAQTIFSTIERVGRGALLEMRRLTGFLRTESDPVTESPQPGLDQLEMLIDGVRSAGIQIRLRIVGEPKALPASLGMSAYRIVQEALTNVLKHAGAAHVHVVIRYGHRYLALTIEDDGAGAGHPPRDGVGFGHLGMRERVALFGGELHVGPRRGRGYRVVAYLPIDEMVG